MLRCLPGSFFAGSQTGAFSNGQKRLRDARTYFRINRQNLTLGEVFVGLPSGRKKLLMCAQCLLCPKSRPATRFGKSRFAIWSWRRDLNPRPSDYKSDALPAELRQHKPPVTGHKVNKLAQRQSACNIFKPSPCQGKRNLRGTAPINILTRLWPLRPSRSEKKSGSSILVLSCSSIANC